MPALIEDLIEKMPSSAESWREGAEQAGQTCSWMCILYSTFNILDDTPSDVWLDEIGIPKHAHRQIGDENVELVRRLGILADNLNAYRKTNRAGFDEAALAALQVMADASELITDAKTLVRQLAEHADTVGRPR